MVSALLRQCNFQTIGVISPKDFEEMKLLCGFVSGSYCVRG